jgi:hypothetical protein
MGFYYIATCQHIDELHYVNNHVHIIGLFYTRKDAENHAIQDIFNIMGEILEDNRNRFGEYKHGYLYEKLEETRAKKIIFRNIDFDLLDLYRQINSLNPKRYHKWQVQSAEITPV